MDKAEIQFEPNGRSKGSGVVKFDTLANADMAISKFTGYSYGGRPLGLNYVRYLNQGDDIAGPDDGGLKQEDMM